MLCIASAVSWPHVLDRDEPRWSCVFGATDVVQVSLEETHPLYKSYISADEVGPSSFGSCALGSSLAACESVSLGAHGALLSESSPQCCRNARLHLHMHLVCSGKCLPVTALRLLFGSNILGRRGPVRLMFVGAWHELNPVAPMASMTTSKTAVIHQRPIAASSSRESSTLLAQRKKETCHQLARKTAGALRNHT